MKLRTVRLIILSTLSLLGLNLFAQTDKIDLSLTNEPLKNFISIVESKTSYTFMLDQTTDQNQSITIDVKQASIETLLSRAFSGTTIVWEVAGTQIILKNKPVSAPPLDWTITGTVTENGKPMPNVSVAVKGTTRGTLTDARGAYSLSLPARNSTLIFSFIGYVSQEIAVEGPRTIDVALSEDNRELEEVVVVGYGTTKKVNLTGAVTQISAEKMKDRPITQMTQALQGMVPNLNITFGSGEPGTSGTLNIRGMTSINGGGPLVLVDGVPGNMDRVNVSDVESVTVLKDASASAIYGARAAFGVILVTTKEAKAGKFQLNYQNNFGWSTHTANTDFITSGYWNAKWNDDAMFNATGVTATRYSEEDYEELWVRRNDKTENPARPWVVVKQDATGRDLYRYYANFDWYNYLFSQWRPKQSHDINITGASDRLRYLLSGGVSDEQGIIRLRPDHNRRYNMRVKADADVSKWLTVGINTSYFGSAYEWYGNATNFATYDGPNTSWNMGHGHAAYVPVNPDGTPTGLTGVNGYSIGNGFHTRLLNGNSKGERSVSEFVTMLQATLKLMKGLTVTGNYTFTQEVNQSYFRDAKERYSKYPGVMELFPDYQTDALTETMRNDRYYVGNIFSTYETSLGSHNLKAMAGFNQELKVFKTLTGTGYEQLSQTLNDLDLTSGTSLVEGGASEWAVRGVFYRLNYDYAGKYLFEASGRYDGTSRFPKKSRFGFFPSFSAGYRVSEEPFFEALKPVVTNLKVRYSYGTLGNQDVSTYAYISTMGMSPTSYTFTGTEYARVAWTPNPVSSELTWERSITNNVGLDANFLKGRLSLTADIYTRDTKDMLQKGKTLPSVFGMAEPKENAADLRTKGFEVSLGWQDRLKIANKPFNYSVNAVLSDNSTRITRFDNPENLLSDYRVGQQVGEIWGYRYDGFFKTTAEAQEYAQQVNQDRINTRRVQAPTATLRMLQAGDIKILDLNEDGEITSGNNTLADPGDREIIGNTTPRYSYGLSASASWNGIDLSILFQGVGKRDWYPGSEAQAFWSFYCRPYDTYIPSNFPDKVWSPDNPNARFPRLIGYIANQSELARENDMYLQDVAYCKLRNLTIGYTLPASLLRKIGISRLRVYLSGENLFTWTKLETDYLDPESVMWDATGRSYPMSKTFSCGLELSF